MKTNKKIFFLLLLSTLLFSCKKDPLVQCVSPDCQEDCLPYEISEMNICFPSISGIDGVCDFVAYNDTVNLWGQVFNPNNSDEILILKNSIFTHNNSVRVCCKKMIFYNHKQNIKLKEIEFDDDKFPFMQASWSKKNEIIFSTVEGEIYKLNAENNVVEFLLEGDNPIWNFTGDKFVFRKDKDVFIANKDGQVLDTLPLTSTFFISDWSEDNNILIDWYLFNYDSKEVTDISPSFPSYIVYPTRKFGRVDSEILSIDSEEGFGAYNSERKNFFLLKPNCSGKYFTSTVSVSSDKRYIATIVRKWRSVESTKFMIYSQLRILDINGNELKTIENI